MLEGKQIIYLLLRNIMVLLMLGPQHKSKQALIFPTSHRTCHLSGRRIKTTFVPPPSCLYGTYTLVHP